MDRDRSSMLHLAVISAVVIVLTRLCGIRTGGMFAVALPPYLLSCGIFMLGGRKRVARFVKMYADNRFYINAKESSMHALYQTVSVSVIAAVVLGVFAYPLPALLAGTVKGRLALFVSVGAMCITGAEAVLMGFLDGMGARKTMATMDIVRLFLIAALGIGLGIPGYRYGQKLDALLFTDDCAGAYCALLAMCGICAAELVMLLLSLLLRFRILGGLKPLHETSKPRYLGDKPAYFSAFLHITLAVTLPHLIVAVTQALICYPERSPVLSGAFYARFLAVTTLCGAALSLAFLKECRVTAKAEKEEEDFGERMLSLIRRVILYSVPVGAFLTALAEPLQDALFVTAEDDATLSLMTGGFLASLLTLAVTGTALMLYAKRYRAFVFTCILTLAVGVALPVLMRLFAAPFIAGRAFVAPAVLLLVFLLYVITCHGFLMTVAGYRRAVFVRLLLRPVGVSAACALVLYLLSNLLVHLIGEWPTCIVCAVLGFAVYLIGLALVRGIGEGDLRDLPFGAMLERISLRKKS